MMDMESMAGRLSELKLAEKSAISLEKTESDYVLHLDMQKHATDDQQTFIAASSSNYTVRIYSKDNLADCGCIQGHEDVITGVRFSPTDRNILYTSSLDKTVRTCSKTAVQTFRGADAVNLPVSSFDLSCNDMVICAGTEATKEDVYLLFWDRRKASLLGCYSECHKDDITQVRFHPTNPDHLATGSTDGLVSILDISETCEDDALTYTLNTESSVSRIGWYGDRHRYLYGLTHIETLHLWDAVEGDDLATFKDIREKYQDTQTKVDYLIDCLQIESDLYLAAGDLSGRVHLMSVKNDQLESTCTLSSGHKDVVRCTYWDSQKSNLITGGEDAMLCLWSPSDCIVQKTPKSSTNKVKAKMKKSVSKKKPY